jgi:transposase
MRRGRPGSGWRALERVGVACLIAAPGTIARPATDRVKTDRRDAELLVRLLMAGQLSAVRVPSVREEVCRDLVRAREDVAAIRCALGIASASCCCVTPAR